MVKPLNLLVLEGPVRWEDRVSGAWPSSEGWSKEIVRRELQRYPSWYSGVNTKKYPGPSLEETSRRGSPGF